MAWESIRGHDAAREQILSAHCRGRLAHAYLFAGPPGVGKHRFATELCKAYLCDNPPASLTACDRCPSCIQVMAGTHPDCFVAVTPEDKLELPIDTMREFCSKLALKPSRGTRKVGIVVDADDFNEESANVFLKALEEPPAGSMLVLLATAIDRQLPTIRSRCQVVRFHPLTDEAVGAILTEHGTTDPSRTQRLVRLAGGCPGRALALMDDALWAFRQTLMATLTVAKPDAVAFAAEWAQFVEEAGKEGAAQRERASHSIRLIIDLLQMALRVALGATHGIEDVSEQVSVRRLADRIDPDGLADLLDACTDADLHVGRRVQLVLVLEALADRLCRPAASWTV